MNSPKRMAPQDLASVAAVIILPNVVVAAFLYYVVTTITSNPVERALLSVASIVLLATLSVVVLFKA